MHARLNAVLAVLAIVTHTVAPTPIPRPRRSLQVSSVSSRNRTDPAPVPASNHTTDLAPMRTTRGALRILTAALLVAALLIAFGDLVLTLHLQVEAVEDGLELGTDHD